MTLSRRIFLLAPAALAACGEEAPPSYPPPSYDYLTSLKLNVGRVEIDDSWVPRGAARRVDHLAPITPREAMRRMAEDRLVAGGNTGRAVFVIEDASIIRGPRNYEASLAVRLDMADEAGNRLGEATARVVQVRPVRGESERAVRDELYAFVRDLMREMNVEFEYQVRRAMRDALQTTSGSAPAPAPVEVQSLDTPGQPGGQAPAAAQAPASPPADPPTTMSPPPGVLTVPGTRPTPLVPR
jgi:hypothetical protein